MREDRKGGRSEGRTCERVRTTRPTSFRPSALPPFLSSLVFLAMLVPRSARADEDTSYGRIEGDLAVAGALGGTFAPRGPRLTADARLRYLQTAGVFLTYEDGAIVSSGALPERMLVTGVELRPLFLARWLKGKELGSPRLDLAIDSLAFEVGATFANHPGRPFGSDRGLSVGLGIEVPLLGRATGPFLVVRGGGRFGDAALAGVGQGPLDRAGFLTVGLGLQKIFGAHVVDLGDRAP